jgi:hypothetical protein
LGFGFGSGFSVAGSGEVVAARTTGTGGGGGGWTKLTTRTGCLSIIAGGALAQVIARHTASAPWQAAEIPTPVASRRRGRFARPSMSGEGPPIENRT